MELFIDTANLEEIKEAASWGVITGATTNPKIISKEGEVGDLKEKILEITEIGDFPLSVESTAEDYLGMVEEAKEYASWHENIVIKIPMGIEGLKAVNILEREEHIKTNVTAIMATNQALLAALAGATYASIFYGRVADCGYDPLTVIKDTSQLFEAKNLKTKIIVGSVRNMLDINKALLAGADIVTVPFQFLKKMAANLKTEQTIREFNDVWRDMKEKGLIRLRTRERASILTLVNK
ncbi:MAG: fructose-6-phosphate aldolase [candidate division Zixibacteria bacterium]|nr:fructose-6-phosphate aldolase [candidate division Zixibacteria bacterium]